jgi:hypothetical protein
MALILSSMTNDQGFPIPTPYARVVRSSVRRNKDIVSVPKFSCDIVVDIWRNADSTDYQPVDTRMHSVEYTGGDGDAVAWAYTQLKTMDEYAGAVDA